jgi:hypothetical protein
LAVEIVPSESSDHRLHRDAARLKAFTAMRALQVILRVPDWDAKVQSALTSSETADLADQASKSLGWLIFASALVAVKELFNDSAAFERDGPLLVSILQIIVVCWKLARELSTDQDESDSMMQLLPLFEPHFVHLSQIAQCSKFDSYFRSAEHKLDVMKRYCQTRRLKSDTPSPVKVQKTMFDFLKTSSKPKEAAASRVSPAPKDTATYSAAGPSATEGAASPFHPTAVDRAVSPMVTSP